MKKINLLLAACAAYTVALLILVFFIIDWVSSPIQRMLSGVTLSYSLGEEMSLEKAIKFFVEQAYLQKGLKLQAVYLDNINKDRVGIITTHGHAFYCIPSLETSFNVDIHVCGTYILIKADEEERPKGKKPKGSVVSDQSKG